MRVALSGFRLCRVAPQRAQGARWARGATSPQAGHACSPARRAVRPPDAWGGAASGTPAASHTVRGSRDDMASAAATRNPPRA